jgi:hypothetical protein
MRALRLLVFLLLPFAWAGAAQAEVRSDSYAVPPGPVQVHKCPDLKGSFMNWVWLSGYISALNNIPLYTGERQLSFTPQKESTEATILMTVYYCEKNPSLHVTEAAMMAYQKLRKEQGIGPLDGP